MEEIILYSNNCPKCKILENELSKRNIVFSKETDVNLMISLGMDILPVLKTGNEMLDYSQAIKWIVSK